MSEDTRDMCKRKECLPRMRFLSISVTLMESAGEVEDIVGNVLAVEYGFVEI